MQHDKPAPLYCGNAREIKRDGKEPFLSVDLDLTELERKGQPFEFEVNHRDGPHRHIRIVVAPLKPENADERRTHSVKVDTWKPDPSKAKPGYADNRATASDRVPADTVQGDVDNVPF